MTLEQAAPVEEETNAVAPPEPAPTAAVAASDRNDDLVHVELTALLEELAQVGEVAGEIDKIAKQTNLLALNATIEAARAGDAGIT